MLVDFDEPDFFERDFREPADSTNDNLNRRKFSNLTYFYSLSIFDLSSRSSRRRRLAFSSARSRAFWRRQLASLPFFGSRFSSSWRALIFLQQFFSSTRRRRRRFERRVGRRRAIERRERALAAFATASARRPPPSSRRVCVQTTTATTTSDSRSEKQRVEHTTDRLPSIVQRKNNRRKIVYRHNPYNIFFFQYSSKSQPVYLRKCECANAT